MNKSSAAWIETDAVVTSCRFQFARLNTLWFGLQTKEKFCIGFDYYTLAGRYSDEFQSPVAIPQDERLKVRYNPRKPQENNQSFAGPGLWSSGSGALAVIGIGGSILLSLAWLQMMRGCQ